MMSLVLCRSGTFFVLTFVMLAQSAWGQRLGPLVKDNQQRSKASSTESTAAAVQPPSLRLSLPAPAVATLPPVGPDDLQRLQPQEGQPPVIGVHRRLPPGAVTQSFSGGAVKTIAEGAWQSTAVGRLWRLKTTSPSARAMRIHFRDFAIGAGSLWLHSPSGQVVGPYSGSGLYGDGDFWGGIVFGDSLTIEYLPDPAATEEAVPFHIVEISHIWDDAFGGGVENDVRWRRGALGSSDRREVMKPLPDRIDVEVGTQSKTSRLTKVIHSVERSVSPQQPRPKAARQLTPGQTADFRLGPVDTPTLFHGDFSYQLEVPEDATRVTFTLESVDPDVDVDLYVRFGEDNTVQNRRVVADYSSEGITGNERIVITPRSDPPLRAGTYFVSVGLFDTGVVAEGTITAEVELAGESPQPTRGRTLTPGQPADFRLGPVDAARLFSGDDSFRLEVSENASRVTFTLESVDPDVDVDLYVRFGEDNTVQNRRVVADYSSEGITGNERIVITPRSDPPLRAGTYFVSVGLFDTGVVAEGTITAEVELAGESPPTISGGPLTPGQPTDFRLGPVDASTLFNGEYSFRLEVSENASRVIFTLESVDPDVDVDLYVRFGENNTVQNRRVVADYSSRSVTGNERIGITHRSDPPLRAGTYFVSVGLFDTGVVADGTITAEVETDTEDCHLDVTCYPEWSSSETGVAQILFETSEGSFICSGTLLNNRQQDLTPYFLTAAHCVATEEEARSVIAFWNYQTQTCNGDLPDFQSVPRTEGARLLSTLGGGTVDGSPNPGGDMTLLRLEGDLPDGVMFQGWDADPQPVGTQVTGIHHPGSDWGVFKRISFGQIIPDPGFGTSGDVYTIVSWPPGQGYTEPGSSGSALFSSPGTVVGTLSFGDIVENACPTSPLLDAYTHFSVVYPRIRQFIDKEFALDFAHFANGASITSSLVFVNVATHPIRPALYFYDKSGHLIDAESVVDVTGDLEVTEDGALTVQTEMEPLGELTISTHGRGEVVTGSVTVASDGPIGGVLRFDLPGIGVAGVGASQPVRDALFPARRQAGGISTAAAIHNPGEEALGVSCRLMKEGIVLEEVEIPLAANGQEARFIEEVFTLADTSDFVGSVRCTAPGLFTGVAVELDAGHRIFTTLPVVPVDQTGGSNKETALDFAHFANGASITSSLVFVNVATHPIRPALYFYDKSGHLIDAESVVDVTGDLEVTEDGALTVQTEMAPLGELTISTHGRGEVVTGSVTVASDGPLGGVLRFDLPGIGVAGVGASPPVRDALFPARRQAGGISTAAAIHNPGEEALGVSCRLMKEGIVLEEVEIPLAANGQEARFIEEVFTLADTSDFVGSVRCTAPGLFTGVAVELDAGHRIFTTLPVVPVIQGEINMETRASAPDLVVQTPSVSGGSLVAGESFTLSAVVRNEGDETSATTTLRYYRSSDATISASDTQVGTDTVSALSASGASDESISLTAPATAGTYYYGACVDPVSGESDLQLPAPISLSINCRLSASLEHGSSLTCSFPNGQTPTD